jgi:predicted SprT family Zn-dependent metalloprotease
MKRTLANCWVQDDSAGRADPEEITDEIALNPAHFATRTPTKILSTLVHEMVHLWQHHCGKPGRRGYHNKQWAAKMREVGLIPTDTGQSGGKETGEKVTHLIEDGGPFDKACTAWLANQGPILYHDRAGDAARKRKAVSKTKYTCPVCELNAWAKPDAHLICGDCNEELEAEQPGQGEE